MLLLYLYIHEVSLPSKRSSLRIFSVCSFRLFSLLKFSGDATGDSEQQPLLIVHLLLLLVLLLVVVRRILRPQRQRHRCRRRLWRSPQRKEKEAEAGAGAGAARHRDGSRFQVQVRLTSFLRLENIYTTVLQFVLCNDHSRPAYPTRHSFVVDMNNRPLYECERKPMTPRRLSPTKKFSTSGSIVGSNHSGSPVKAFHQNHHKQDAGSQVPSPRKASAFFSVV